MLRIRLSPILALTLLAAVGLGCLLPSTPIPPTTIATEAASNATRAASTATLATAANLGASTATLAATATAPTLSPTNTAAPATVQPRIATTRDLGALGRPASVSVRDGGASALIGAKVLWTFGDTIFTPKSIDGANLRSNTAALADPASPLQVGEPLDANGAPYPFLTFTPDEQHYNDSTGKPDDRIALWIGSVTTTSPDTGLVFYTMLKVKPGALNYELQGVGLACVTAGQTVAKRDPGLLFTASEPDFVNAFVSQGMLYVYGNLNRQTLDAGLARVPLAQVAKRTAYRFWDGTNWVTDDQRAQPILHDIPNSVSVSYNPYLRQFLAVTSGTFLRSPNQVLMRTAPNPQGPWSEPTVLLTGEPPPANMIDYAGMEHPELASGAGRSIVISYFHPLGFLQGELRLVEITFE